MVYEIKTLRHYNGGDGYLPAYFSKRRRFALSSLERGFSTNSPSFRKHFLEKLTESRNSFPLATDEYVRYTTGRTPVLEFLRPRCPSL
mmetsp:Transcript_21192/g.51193  ORF Transcript_21192/g.51193 Transcript_21192/m.51193 type:complete len:88 (+) Transcript_21192:80-343(+)